MRVALVAGLAAAALAAVPASAQSGPPLAGLFEPGRSLGGVGLGWTRAQVEAVWGTRHGRCRSCPRPTLLFNRVPFRPQGTGIELRGGRVAGVFTLWAPRGWHTTRGVSVGRPEIAVTSAYGTLPRTRCTGYDALVLPDRPGRSVIYVRGGEVFGFGLLSPAARVCR